MLTSCLGSPADDRRGWAAVPRSRGEEVTESAPKQVRLPSEVRRGQIGLAARHVFAVHGTAAKTRDIAKAANVTEAVLYRHFRSKDEIYEEAVLRPLEQTTAELMRVAMIQASASDGHLRWELSQEFQRDVLSVMERLMPLVGVALMSEEGRRFYQERVVPLIDLAVESTARAMSDEEKALMDPRTLLVFIAGMYFGVCLDAMLGGSELNPDQLSRELTALVAFGLARPKSESSKTGTSTGRSTAEPSSPRKPAPRLRARKSPPAKDR
jgi:AcrR family transcriptional regulator